ncbi:hypothetical protein CPC08DRAFT_547753 [Agrocybe pediades]|nr:hypothetical protein CPC08DRAFT_547753 [Agrocybe pediades]
MSLKSFLGDPEAVEEARRRIDIERAVLQASLRNLGAQRNLYAPVARLPHEVLCLIFSHYQETSKLTNRRSPLGHWIVITHVCQLWRQVALQYSSLWTDIPFQSPRWALEMLKRSKGADLIAHINLHPYPKQFQPGPSFEVVRAFMEKDLYRAKELVLKNVTTTKLTNIFDNIPLTRAPRLRVLKLAQSYYRSTATQDTVELLNKILCGTTNLQELEVFHTSRWDSKLFNDALTSLTINNPNMKDRPPLSDFLDALSQMSFLKKLRLLGVVLPAASPKTHHGPPIDFPYLEILDFSDGLAEVSSALSYIRFPPNCLVRLQCDGPSNPNLQLSRMMQHMRELYSPSNSSQAQQPRFVSCKVKMLYHPGSDVFFGIEVWPELTEIAGYYPDRSVLKTPSLEFELSWPATDTPAETTRRNLRHIFNEVFSAVPCQNLKVISIVSNDVSVISPKTFQSLGNQPDLTSLYLSGPITPAFLPFLEQSPKENQNSQQAQDQPQQPEGTSSAVRPEPMRFPALQHLDIENTEFEDADQYPFPALKAYLTKRKNNECGLETLCLANPANITDEDVVEFKALVTNFHCEEFDELMI